MERTQSFEQPAEYFGISEEERENAVESAGLPEDTTREELTEDYFESWLAQKGAEYSKGKSKDELKNEFAEVWANPEFRTAQYEVRAKVTGKINAAHEKNAQTPEQAEPKEEEEAENGEEPTIEDQEEPDTKTDKPTNEDEKEDEKPRKVVQKAPALAKELNMKPDTELFEVKKEIAKRLGIEDIESLKIADFLKYTNKDKKLVDVPTKWVSDLITTIKTKKLKTMDSDEAIWVWDTLKKRDYKLDIKTIFGNPTEYIIELENEEIEQEKRGNVEARSVEDETGEIKNPKPEDEKEGVETDSEQIDAMDASEKWKSNLKVSLIKGVGTFDKKAGEFEWAQKALNELGYKFKPLGRGTVEGAIITGITKK